MPVISQSITPHLSFSPYYIERVWFGERAEQMRARVWRADEKDGLVEAGRRERQPDGSTKDSPPIVLVADGVLATLPMLFGQGDFLVRYYLGSSTTVLKTARASVTRREGQMYVNLIYTD